MKGTCTTKGGLFLALTELTQTEVERKLRESKATMALFLYTPLCGTCKVADQMLRVVWEMLPSLPLFSCNINRGPQLARTLQIRSVPCVALFRQGRLVHKEYAMHSVGHLYQLLAPLVKSET